MLSKDDMPALPDYPAPPSNPPSAPGTPPPEYAQLTKAVVETITHGKKDTSAFGFRKFHG